MQSGINYFFNLLSLNPGIFSVYYEFDGSGGGASIPSVSGANPLYSGILSSIGNFYQNSGSGLFTGQNVQITNETGLFSPNWTMIFVYEKLTSNHGILFSSYHGNTVKSGFAIGINDANKLYYETFSNQGPSVIECTLDLGAKSAISVTQAGNSIFFGLYDFNAKVVDTENYSVASNYVFNSLGWHLGDAPNPPSYFSGKPFNGYLDTFLYFSASLMPYQLLRLFSGVYAGPSGVCSLPYVWSFGMDGIAFTTEVDGTDGVEVFTFPQSTNKTTVGNLATYGSSYQSFTLQSNVSQNLINSYLNGAAQFPSGYSVSGGVYNPVYLLSGDFFISGLQVMSTGFYTFGDLFLYDQVSGERGFVINPTGNYSVNLNVANSHVFLNGVKLRSGIDYVPSGDQMWIENSTLTGVCGAFFNFPIDSDIFNYTSGSFNAFSGQRFARGTSEVWLNGLRQALTTDYVEVSAIDLLHGSGTFIDKPTIMNNDSLFWV